MWSFSVDFSVKLLAATPCGRSVTPGAMSQAQGSAAEARQKVTSNYKTQAPTAPLFASLTDGP